jgi:hypothetical protein
MTRTGFSLALAGALAAAVAQAQQPALQWQPMREAAFHAPSATPTASDDEHKLLARIWLRELAGAGEMIPGTQYPSAVLIGALDTGAAHVVFSSYARAGYDQCQQAENGAKVAYSHWVCPLRVARTEAGKVSVQDFPGYCMLWGDDEDAPRSRNRVEYAYDARTATLRLRTIEHGKVVPQCNRSLHLRG